MFNPDLKIGQAVTNDQICEIFTVSPRGGMRRSRKTNTLVVISFAYIVYQDRWKGDTLHLTGMGLVGDQKIDYCQNRTLYESNYNGVEVHLFEGSYLAKFYNYCGVVRLVEEPYQEKQKDENEKERLVWVFPLKPIIPLPRVLTPEGDEPTPTKENRDNLNKSIMLIGRRIEHKKFGKGSVFSIVVTQEKGTIYAFKVRFDNPTEGKYDRTFSPKFLDDNEIIKWL